jgi:hypothetical protein
MFSSFRRKILGPVILYLELPGMIDEKVIAALFCGASRENTLGTNQKPNTLNG